MFGFLYRMPIWIVFFAIFIVLVLYGKFISVDRVQNSRAWRILNLILIFASAIFILEMTLTSRTASSNGLYLIPFRFLSLAKINIEIYRSITMNIALFIPFGMFISSFSTPHLKIKKGIIIAVTSALFFSVAIEYAQYLLHCGETETDDVIFNTLGALVGSLVVGYKSLTAKISGSRYFDINAIKYLSITFFCSWTLWSFVSYFTTFYYHLKPISTVLYILGSFAPLNR
jgi:glycopeptide antibiotics resistance protein